MKMKGKEPTEVVSIRLEPRIKGLIKWRFGSVQKWVDETAQKLQDRINSVETKNKKGKEEV